MHFPKTIDEAVALLSSTTELRAGGTDWLERHDLGLVRPELVELRDVAGLDGIEQVDEGLRIGSRVTLRALLSDPRTAAYPALRLAASTLATPQIRALATLGGSLLQRSRCWYYRSVEHRCLKSGGDRCFARTGDHLLHACFDLGPCVAPHPSTVGLALSTYDAHVEVVGVAGATTRSLAEIFGDGSDARDHRLADGELLSAVILPAPVLDERGGYFRATSRAAAEWPLVEVAVRLVLDSEVIRLARVALGGVAPIPLRVPRAEALLEGTRGDEAFAAAGAVAAEGASPLPMTRYKVAIIPGAVHEALTRALGGA